MQSSFPAESNHYLSIDDLCKSDIRFFHGLVGGTVLGTGAIKLFADYAEVKSDGCVTQAITGQAMEMLNIDEQGFDTQDRKLLLTIIEKFDGGPVGVDSLSAAIGEERGTIEDVLEPYLIQQGFIMRTQRGRMATRNAYLHCGLKPPVALASEPLELLPGETGEGVPH